MELHARRVIDGANLSTAHRPYAHEIEQGHWDIPDAALQAGIHMPTMARLFMDWPEWCVIVVFNKEHIHVDSTTGERTVGVWTVFEANPTKIPRKYHPAFPLLVYREEDGVLTIDRKKGKPAHPSECYQVILDTLKHKDAFNAQKYKDVAEPYREVDRHNDGLKDRNDDKLKKLDENFLTDIVNEERPTAHLGRGEKKIILTGE